VLIETPRGVDLSGSPGAGKSALSTRLVAEFGTNARVLGIRVVAWRVVNELNLVVMLVPHCRCDTIPSRI